MGKAIRLKGFKIQKGKEFEGNFPTNLYTVRAEHKIDGLRGVILFEKGKATAYTSTGVLVPNARLICESIQKCWPENNRMIDGEFFLHNWGMTQSIVKTQVKHKKAKLLRFVAFDTMSMKEWNAKECSTLFRDRHTLLNKQIKKYHIRAHGNYLIDLCYGEEVKIVGKQMEKFKDEAIKAQVEGVMFKIWDGLYEFKKSRQWQKWKPKYDADLLITGAKEEVSIHGQKKNALGALILEGDYNGTKVWVDCGGGFKRAQRIRFWEDFKSKNLIGRIAEIKHEGLTKPDKKTKKRSLRFPEFHRMRTSTAKERKM